ncbi:hypothetical protein [Actinoplanes lobatus]|uniref:Uncharacterized protein n=1 Tax=Actinoplanes lobatus TaxID=113568 RepID=A0A7W7ML90_9ACTN|nr:hypothetical protein [Actinoplanes lobatus]MBB4754519.1 hypothetical protein [Actinoplanes lobatus]
MRNRYLDMLRATAIVQVVVRRLGRRDRPAGEPGRHRPVAGPIPAGWPEVAHDQPAPAPDPLADAVTRRITAAQRSDLPVAGRPVPGYGVPWSGYSAPRHAAEDPPLSLRFRGPDGSA